MTTDPTHQLPSGRDAIEAAPERPPVPAETAPAGDGVDALRDDIARTRARMSRTLDRIEDRLVRRRDELWSAATLEDVRRRWFREPWRTLLIAFVAGYIIAALRD